MRRWLIGIFALHFFLNVGLFAVGKIDTLGTGHATSESSAALFVGSDHPTHSEGLMGAAPDHALTDGQADLPEMLAVSIALAKNPSPAISPAPPPFVKLVLPMKERPRHPPRPDATPA